MGNRDGLELGAGRQIAKCSGDIFKPAHAVDALVAPEVDWYEAGHNHFPHVCTNSAGEAVCQLTRDRLETGLAALLNAEAQIALHGSTSVTCPLERV